MLLKNSFNNWQNSSFMVFTFDSHAIQDNKGCMVPCYVITHSNHSETKFHHVIKFDQWNASLVYVMTNKA